MKLTIKTASTLGTFLFGVLLSTSTYANNISYEKDIKPIFVNTCVECHSGSLKYEVVYSQRFKILNKLKNNEMPPKYTTGLSQNEKNLVIQWIETGAKK